MPDAELARAVALAREVLHRSGALRVSVALDGDAPATIECARLRAIVVRDGAGERELPHDAAHEVELPELPPLHQMPAFAIDPDRAEVTGMLGGLQMLGRAMRGVANLLPPGSVVAAEFETDRQDVPLGLAGRAGEPLFVLIGDEEFELELDEGAPG